MPSEHCLSIQEMLTGQRLCHSETHNDTVLAALNQQRSDGILCDVTLIAEEQKFHAHKAVLAACSDYFRAMFSLCMVESGADEVNLRGVTSLGLKQALEFAYTGQILLEPGVIQDVLAAGSHLQLLELLNLCSHYLIQQVLEDSEKRILRRQLQFLCPSMDRDMLPFLQVTCPLQVTIVLRQQTDSASMYRPPHRVAAALCRLHHGFLGNTREDPGLKECWLWK